MSSEARAARNPEPPVGNTPRGTGFWISAWWPVALGIVVIAIESQEFMGANHTSLFLRPIWQFLFGRVSDARWQVIHHYIRKSGHFVGYGAIGVAWLRAWRMTLPNAKFLADAALAMLGTATIAGLDEWHQSFLPNRTSSVWDVLLDCAGALLMISLTCLMVKTARPKRLTFAV